MTYIEGTGFDKINGLFNQVNDDKHDTADTTPSDSNAPSPSAPPHGGQKYTRNKVARVNPSLTPKDRRGWRAAYLETEGLQLEDAEDRLQRFQQRSVRTQQLQLSSQQNKSAEYMKNMNETDIMSAIYNESDRIMDYVAQIT